MAAAKWVWSGVEIETVPLIGATLGEAIGNFHLIRCQDIHREGLADREGLEASDLPVETEQNHRRIERNRGE